MMMVFGDDDWKFGEPSHTICCVHSHTETQCHLQDEPNTFSITGVNVAKLHQFSEVSIEILIVDSRQMF